MRSSEQVNRGNIALPIAYDVAKRYLALDDDDRQAEVIETVAEVLDELELATNSIIAPRSCTKTFYEQAPEFMVPGIVTSITSVLDVNSVAVAHSLMFIGTAAVITPTSSVALPVTITYEGGEIRPAVRRLLKEMLAFKFRFKGDEASDYPASIQRAMQRLTKFRI